MACGHDISDYESEALSNYDFAVDSKVESEFDQFNSTGVETKTTFSIDVDTASYSITRSIIEEGYLPEHGSVRLEEFVNYFDYEYAESEPGLVFTVHTEVGCEFR